MTQQSTKDLLSTLLQRGINLWLENGELRFQSPEGTLTPEELKHLRARKDSIIDLLKGDEFASEPPLRPRMADSQIPLTTIQLNWWKPGVSERNSYVATRVCGNLNTCLLRRCLEELVRRHESLRTRVVVVDGTPVQHVDGLCKPELTFIDISRMHPFNAEQEALRVGEEFVREKIDRSIGPLFAAKLFRLPNEHVLILASDQLISDGFSNTILSREIWTLYGQADRGLPLSLPKLPLQFPDYAIWQQQTRDAWLNKHAKYWRERLNGAPSIRLPVEGQVRGTKTRVGASKTIPFGNELSASLRDVARREGVLPALALLTVYVAVMSNWCNRQELVLTVITDGRNRPELHNMIGLFAYALHLRINVSKEDNFHTLLKQIDFEFRAAYEHQGFGRVPHLVPNCITELSFNWLPAGCTWTSSADLRMRLSDEFEVLPFPLEVNRPWGFIPWFYNTADGLNMTVGYSSDLFSAGTIQCLGENIRLLVEEFARDPWVRIASVCTRLVFPRQSGSPG